MKGYVQYASVALPLVILAVGLLFLLSTRHLREIRRRAEDRYWQAQLAHLIDLKGAELVHAVQQAFATTYTHPRRGEVSLNDEELMRQLGFDQAAELAHARQREQDRYWHEMLKPYLGLPVAEVEEALHEISSRTHAQPLEGIGECDVDMLRRQLERARRFEP